MVKLSDFSEHIQKSFTSPESERDLTISKIENQLSSNLYKGLIDGDTYDKAVAQLDNLIKAKGGKGEGSKGGKVIGHTHSGKPVYQRGTEGHKEFSPQDHKDASDLHAKEAQKHLQESYARPDKYGKDVHSALAEHHKDASQYHEKKGIELAKKELNPGEKKILTEQKKDQMTHHDKLHEFHSGMAKEARKRADATDHEESKKYMNETADSHQRYADAHKSAKENLENEKKGY